MSALRALELTKSFGALRAVDAVSLSVGAGEVCGLVGPNGSGKTTLLNLISGFLVADRGSVEIDGHRAAHLPPFERSRLGLARTFQLVRLAPRDSVFENVLVGCYHDAPDTGVLGALLPTSRVRRGRSALADRAREALERVGIGHLAGVPAGALPYGTQRRVEVARALVAHPKLLLLDEPAAGLTETESAALGELIVGVAGEGCGVVLVDHDLGFVTDTCGRLVVMNFGQVIFDGPSTDAVEDPLVRSSYVGS